MSEKFIHCWEGFYDEMRNEIAICLLPLGHEGEHQPTPGKDIRITFREPLSPQTTKQEER